jgi:hypothetical protein
VDLVRQLRRRAVGASLLVPLVLLLAAAAVAASGGGLGGLGSLGQLSSGPALPETGLAGATFENSGSAEIVGAQTGEAPTSAATDLPGAGGDALASAGAGGGVTAPFAPSDGSAPVLPPPGADDVVTVPPGGRPVDEPGSAPPASTTPANPVDQVINDTRRIGESLPGPLGPVAGGILDLLLGPRR